VSVREVWPEQRGGDGTMSWALKAGCRDVPPKVFFPHDGAGVDDARRYCDRCPVRVPCLEYALENQIQHGVWGGMSERARQRIARRRKVEGSATRYKRIAEAR
jgi:WhiB family transcriptional regulator, redox-sensing transcriptional regulator